MVSLILHAKMLIFCIILSIEVYATKQCPREIKVIVEQGPQSLNGKRSHLPTDQNKRPDFQQENLESQ